MLPGVNAAAKAGDEASARESAVRTDNFFMQRGEFKRFTLGSDRELISKTVLVKVNCNQVGKNSTLAV